MNKIVSEFDTRKWFFKTKFMSGHRYNNYLWKKDLEGAEGLRIEFVRHFENAAPLAINDWLGIIKINFNWGYRQYLVSTAAGIEDAYETLRLYALKVLGEQGLDFAKNDVEFLEERDSEYLDALIAGDIGVYSVVSGTYKQILETA